MLVKNENRGRRNNMSPNPVVRSTLAWAPALLLALAAPEAAAQAQPEASAPVARPGDTSAAAARESVGSFLDAPPELLARLSDREVFRLLQDRLDLERRRNEPEWVSGAVPLAFFAAVFFVVWIVLQHRARQEAKRHETMRAMIDKGMEIPRELIAPVRKNGTESPAMRDLRRGLLLISGGIGVSALFAVIGIWEEEALRGTGIGLVPLFLGIGYLIVGRLGRKAELRE
jgi:hypothetical protein